MLVLGISGSSAPSRHTRALVELALQGAAGEAGVRGGLVDLSETVLEFADGRPPEGYGEATRAVLGRMAEADAFVLGTPMYRGGMTGALKNLLDLTPREAMVGKSAALVATGASAHHYLGVELGLRTALAFFQMHVVPAALYGADVRLADGRPADPRLAEEAAALGRDLVRLARAVGRSALGPSLRTR